MGRRPELRYTLHNPNAPDVTAKYIYKFLVLAAKRKFDRERQKPAEVEIQREGSR